LDFEIPRIRHARILFAPGHNLIDFAPRPYCHNFVKDLLTQYLGRVWGARTPRPDF
jgi:hypothetical protein